MPLRIERMTEEDYFRIGKEVKDGFVTESTYLPASLSASEIFGSSSYRSGEDRPVCIDHKRGFIHLCKPVVNFAIAQQDAELLRKLLGVDSEKMKAILNFDLCYDVSCGECIPIEEVSSVNDVLWGAEVLRKWIDEFDVELAIQEYLEKLMLDYKKAFKVSGEGQFKRASSGGYLAAGDWRFFPEREERYDGLAQYIGQEVFCTNTSRLSYLINLQGHKDRLYAMILEYIAVVPLGMRPDIENRHDQLSCAYADVISANKNLRMFMSGMFEPRAFVDKYRILSDRVYNLLVKPQAFRTTRKSIIEKLASKEGHIREKMLGTRVDYSGRSVITIDPFLSIRKVKIPRDMAPKLYRGHILSSMQNPNPSDWIGADKRDKCNTRLVNTGILDKVPVVIGRQPTLHKLSMRAFKAELTDERSVCINPLCVTGFNADFDGDQMWVRVPISDGAVEEVRELMRIERNIYYPKNGECSVMPRQEIIYGLNVCTRAGMQKGPSKGTYTDVGKLFDDLYMQRVKVSDTVTYDGYTDCAGRVAFAACLPTPVFQKMGVREVTSKSIGPYIDAMLEVSVEQAIDSIDTMVQLGFKISYLYPPTLNLLDEEDITYAEDMTAFHLSLREITDLYERGLEEAEAYDAAYDQQFMAVEERVKNTIYDRVGRESGFVRMAESGARGSKSNLIQMYGYKGRIQKSSRESFKAVIEHSYAEQLTPLEHFVTAYGGRQGLINKSLNTADTGYAMRKMWHAASPYVITCDDCGTTEGIEIKKSDIAMFATTKEEVDDIFCKIITGRYQAKTDVYITKSIAKALCQTQDTVVIRSVLTCKDPCCKKCYGEDLSTHQLAAVGLPVGFIAAHSIGEPGTQLSMDSFKKGGIASKCGVTSAFDKLSAYIECTKLYNNKNFGSYDPVAWASGPVREVYNADGSKTVRIKGSLGSKRLPADAVIRKEAVKGEGLCMERGDYDINELLQHTDVRTTQLYLLHTLYNIYKDECEISMKHFEVLVAAMTMHMVISTDRKDLYVGQYHDTIQMLSGSLDNTVYYTTIRGVKQVQPSRTHMLSRVIMESLKSGLASSLLLGLEDPLEYPLNQIMMGQSIYCGGMGRFLEERRI